ncbi:hypothetical protein BDZ45DRAFT_704998 [Acephala macrosclerotiorum]|nr:hypothetical protein BDZ45DRAFT_704998 [Acephala macrosclerotiorum]
MSLAVVSERKRLNFLNSNGCGMDIGVKDGKMVRVRGHAVDRVNKGRLGPRGMPGWVSNAHKNRLKYPLIRKNGKLERASWDKAMNLMIEKAKDMRKRFNTHGIGFYISGQLFLEEHYALAVIGKGGLNTLHPFGADSQPGSYTDTKYTDCLFIAGHNVSATQTFLWTRMLDRLTGPDLPKLIHLLFKNDWMNEKWCSEHVVGLDELREGVTKHNPQHVEEITRILASQLEDAAKIIGTTRSLLSTAFQGVYQSNKATASACRINKINLLRGLIGKAGSAIYQMNGQPTAQKNRETGCDGEFPGFRNQVNPDQMQEIADIWNINYNRTPHWGEPTHIHNMLKFIKPGAVEMFWISGTNPLLLRKPELFVVCQDIMTETAAIADLTFHLSHKAIDPRGEARSDLDILVDFGKRADLRGKDGKPMMRWSKPEDFSDWRRVSKGRPCNYSEMKYAKLTGYNPNRKERLFEDGVFFTEIEYCESCGHDLETGTPYTKDEYRAMNLAGRAFLKSADYIPSLEVVNEVYPMQLSTGRQVYHFHMRMKTGRARALQDAAPEPFF